MKYDMAAITIPMLLIAWRTLHYALNHSPQSIDDDPAAATSRTRIDAPKQHRSVLTLILVGAACFLVPNLITVAGPTWWPVELAVMLGIFAMGISSLKRPSLEVQASEAQPSIIPTRVVYEEAAPIEAVEPIAH
jgi:hypothetical protein